MKTLKGAIEIGFANATRYFEFEVEDDATDEQIQEALQEAAHQYVEIYLVPEK